MYSFIVQVDRTQLILRTSSVVKVTGGRGGLSPSTSVVSPFHMKVQPPHLLYSDCSKIYIVTVLEQYVDVMGFLECNTFFNFVTVNSLCVYCVTIFSLS